VRETPHPSAMLRIAATLSHKGRGFAMCLVLDVGVTGVKKFYNAVKGGDHTGQ